ncbi:MAG TPA: hypothetical protein VK861_07745, partial [Bacteroidales bacterium]|nr:hypothetical protein [Bacteroidales bacterium]
ITRVQCRMRPAGEVSGFAMFPRLVEDPRVIARGTHGARIRTFYCSGPCAECNGMNEKHPEAGIEQKPAMQWQTLKDSVLPPMTAAEKIKAYLASLQLDGEGESLSPRTCTSEDTPRKKMPKRYARRKGRRSPPEDRPEKCRVLMMYARLGNTEDQDTRSPIAPKKSPKKENDGAMKIEETGRDTYLNARLGNTEDQDTRSPKAPKKPSKKRNVNEKMGKNTHMNARLGNTEDQDTRSPKAPKNSRKVNPHEAKTLVEMDGVEQEAVNVTPQRTKTLVEMDGAYQEMIIEYPQISKTVVEMDAVNRGTVNEFPQNAQIIAWHDQEGVSADAVEEKVRSTDALNNEKVRKGIANPRPVPCRITEGQATYNVKTKKSSRIKTVNLSEQTGLDTHSSYMEVGELSPTSGEPTIGDTLAMFANENELSARRESLRSQSASKNDEAGEVANPRRVSVELNMKKTSGLKEGNSASGTQTHKVAQKKQNKDA